MKNIFAFLSALTLSFSASAGVIYNDPTHWDNGIWAADRYWNPIQFIASTAASAEKGTKDGRQYTSTSASAFCAPLSNAPGNRCHAGTSIISTVTYRMSLSAIENTEENRSLFIEGGQLYFDYDLSAYASGSAGTYSPGTAKSSGEIILDEVSSNIYSQGSKIFYDSVSASGQLNPGETISSSKSGTGLVMFNPFAETVFDVTLTSVAMVASTGGYLTASSYSDPVFYMNNDLFSLFDVNAETVDFQSWKYNESVGDTAQPVSEPGSLVLFALGALTLFRRKLLK